MRESTKIPKLISIALFYNYKLSDPSGWDGFMVSGPYTASQTAIAVYDLQGWVVEMLTTGKAVIKIDHRLPEGSYILKFVGVNAESSCLTQVP